MIAPNSVRHMALKPTEPSNVVIIGAGPAGLTAAYELSKHGVPAVVLESDSAIGGLSRTIHYKGYLFDVGGHRFFSKWDEVNGSLEEILGNTLPEAPSPFAHLLRKRFFYYPLKPANALFGLGPIREHADRNQLPEIPLTYYPVEENLEQWVSNRFGKRAVRFFSRPTQKKSGAFRVRKFARNGRRNVFRASRYARRSQRHGVQQDPGQNADSRVSISAARAGTDVGDVAGRVVKARSSRVDANTRLPRHCHDKSR